MHAIPDTAGRPAWRPDLHVHTNASDGIFAPSDVMRRAKERGVNLVAVTDHDTLLALPESARAAMAHGIAFIPGVEISTAGDDEVHVLGLFVGSHMKNLSARLRAFRGDKQRRCVEALRILTNMGLPLTLQDLRLPHGVAGSRPLIARAMVRKGYAASVPDAFERFLAVGRRAYVPRRNMDTGEAIALLSREGAVPVLAHPALIAYERTDLLNRLEQWMAQGLRGIEAWHPAHTPETARYWAGIARSRGLLVTGGSDFHDGLPPHGELGDRLPLWDTADSDAARLLDMDGEEVAV